MNRYLTVTVAVVLATLTASASAPATTADRHPADNWVSGWTASPVVGSDVPWNDCPADQGLTDQTVRNVVFLSAGGQGVRVRITNTFGTQAIRVGSASVAVQAADARAVPGTVRQLAFNGRREVTVAAGGRVLSDPVRLDVAPLSTLLVSVYVPEATGPVTNHPFTAQGNFLAAGDRALSPTGDGYGSTPCWMLVDGVDVRAPSRFTGSVVTLGDSITDTSATTGNANRRWPDYLARRLNAKRGPTYSVANAGLGGNRLLAPREDGAYWGVPALARLERDVYAQTGARAVIVLEGVNDIGFDATADELIAGYQQVIAQAHAQGLRVYGATITPFGGSFIETPERLATWHAVNRWIRGSGAFDGVFDFARAVAAPDDPEALAPAYDSGDHLHPNDAGCEAMANAVNLNTLVIQASLK